MQLFVSSFVATRDPQLNAEPAESEPRTARPERRNWKLRRFLTVTDRRGPMRYWPLGLLILCLVVTAARRRRRRTCAMSSPA
jgi:hypothetical protein